MARFPLWDANEYVAASPDLAGWDGLQHFLQYGAWELDRPLCKSKRMAQFLGAAAQEPRPDLGPVPEPEAARLSAAAARLDIGVYASSEGSFIGREIAQLVAGGLAQAGARVRLLNEQAPISERPDLPIIVAPHEFFTRGRGVEWATKEVVASCLIHASGHMYSRGFKGALPYLLASRGGVTDSFENTVLLARAGVPCGFHFPGVPPLDEAAAEGGALSHPLAAGLSRSTLRYALGTDIWAERPLDLVFMGNESPARDDFFSRHAAVLAELNCVIHYTRMLGAQLTEPLGGARAAFNRFAARRTKVMLNLHPGEVGGFNWVRMALFGMRHRALVVSQPCVPHPVFQAGVHYLEETPRRIPKLVEWLIRTPDGRATAEKVRTRAYAALMEQTTPRRMALRLVPFLLETSGRA